IRFNPSAAGTRAGTVTFHTDNVPGIAMVTVNLSGDGTTGLYSATASGAGDFGTVVAGTSAGLDIAVTHTGGAPKGVLTFSTVTVTPGAGYAGWFSISAQPNTLSNTTQTGTVTVTCSPPLGSTATGTATVN